MSVSAEALRLPAACAVPNDAGGALAQRKYAETPHSYRSPFQRDRARIIHARAFRRLAGKTQVFTHRHSDHFRSRLTHTMEVAQIARTIATALGLNEDLAEALALVHDIGHPPFGHAGERALDDGLRRDGLRFDHNLHALRIVEYFEQRYAAYRGLNLTLAVREGIIKHSRDYAAAEHPELAEYFLDRRPPLEAQIIDLADEIAYTTADLDDGYDSGILTVAQMREQVGLFERFYRQMEQAHPGVAERLIFNEALKRMLNAMVGDLIAETGHRVEAGGIDDLDGIRAAPARLAAFSAETETLRLEAKRFLYTNLYNSAELGRDHEEAERVIHDLYTAWTTKPELLPEDQRAEIPAEGLARVVADYLAGMTDNFILAQHRWWLESRQANARATAG